MAYRSRAHRHPAHPPPPRAPHPGREKHSSEGSVERKIILQLTPSHDTGKEKKEATVGTRGEGGRRASEEGMGGRHAATTQGF